MDVLFGPRFDSLDPTLSSGNPAGNPAGNPEGAMSDGGSTLSGFPGAKLQELDAQ